MRLTLSVVFAFMAWLSADRAADLIAKASVVTVRCEGVAS